MNKINLSSPWANYCKEVEALFKEDKEVNIMFEIYNLCKNFDNLNILNNINVKINDGEKVVILGPSGYGKSTFLRCLNGLETPSSGRIDFNGIDLNTSNKNLRLVRKKSEWFSKSSTYSHI